MLVCLFLWRLGSCLLSPVFLTPPPPVNEPFLLARHPTSYTHDDVTTSESLDGKGVQTEDRKKKKTELENSSSLPSCKPNVGGVHRADEETNKTEGCDGETQATTTPLIEESAADIDEYENREKKRTREACGTPHSSDGQSDESVSVVVKEGELAYVVWEFSRQHKAHVVVPQQGDTKSASRESFGGLSGNSNTNKKFQRAIPLSVFLGLLPFCFHMFSVTNSSYMVLRSLRGIRPSRVSSSIWWNALTRLSETCSPFTISSLFPSYVSSRSSEGRRTFHN